MTIQKTCSQGHHYYTGTTCPVCEYFGTEDETEDSNGKLKTKTVNKSTTR